MSAKNVMDIGHRPVLPDGIFSNQNSNLGKFRKLLQLKMLNVYGNFCVFDGQMVYFMAIWYIL
jgi:hypothetical protein